MIIRFELNPYILVVASSALMGVPYLWAGTLNKGNCFITTFTASPFFRTFSSIRFLSLCPVHFGAMRPE